MFWLVFRDEQTLFCKVRWYCKFLQETRKFIDHTQYHTITQLYSHIVQETGPLDTVYIIIHHCPSFSIIVHHESKQVASLHLLARNPLTASGDNWLPAFCFMSSRCSLWLRLLLRRLTCQELWNMFEAVECDRLRDEDDQFKDKIDRHAPLAVWTIQQVTCLEYTYTLCLIQLN